MKGKNHKGFTLIEMMMVIILVTILAVVAIPQFVDFRADARNALVQSTVAAIRTAISIQQSQMYLRCNAASGSFPTILQMQNNDITNGASPCTALMIPSANDRRIVPSQYPDNPWSGSSVSAAGRHAITACVTSGCARNNVKSCDSTNWGVNSGGWCYNALTGIMWANSNNNGGGAASGEYTY